jgi:hypothetical protein
MRRNQNYPRDTALKIVTLEDVLFLGRRNDVSFLMEDRLVVLMEHQSTVCENMPVRLLIYLSYFYEKWFNMNEQLKQAIYGTQLLKIPKPEFYVFYNGQANFPERKVLKLSDAFRENSKAGKEIASEWSGGFLELIVPIYNINRGFNEEILEKSETLSGYVVFVDSVRWYRKSGHELEGAIRRAVEDCIEKGILADFLRLHSSEVINMLTAEFNLEDALQVRKEEGRKEGITEGEFKAARKMLAYGITLSEISKILELPMDKLQTLGPTT